MKLQDTHAHDFDSQMRARHTQSTMQLSQRTRTQLYNRLRNTLAENVGRGHGHRPAWLLATACSLALVLGFGMQWRTSDEMPPVSAKPVTLIAARATPESGEPVAALDESPDLYLWLASDDAKSFATE